MWRDAVIIGGGPAGATAALLLSRAGWSVATVEMCGFPRRKVCGEFLSATNLPLLRELGIADVFLHMAGPPVTRVGVFAGAHKVVAGMPRLDTDAEGWGRALGREHLDTLLLDRAAASGAIVWQPYMAVKITGSSGDFRCTIVRRGGAKRPGTGSVLLRTPVLIAAHGSWHPGTLPTQPPHAVPRPADLFGFKARFARARLERGLMPLLAFPGGYGGMVHTDHDSVSFSCCVRRDQLERCRRVQPDRPAGAAVLAHVMRACDGVREALDGADLEADGWRAAGPIRPGIRVGTSPPGIFLAGNAAGEAHPIVAEGISMAMQSAWLLGRHLVDGAAATYELEWRRAFTTRIHAASLIAHWAMRPTPVALTLPLLRAFPRLITRSAKTTGKVSVLCTPRAEPA
jgi:2-polyprenyl-6-methoxyphenol hydroxylase-like FAD-dependent oxidoreductase